MAKIVAIKGVPVIEIYESFDGSYWFITEKLRKQDSVIHGKVYKDDQILFGYVKLSACPEFAEWGNVSETELRLLGGRVWKVRKKNWSVCPEVEVVDADVLAAKQGQGEKLSLAIYSPADNNRFENQHNALSGSGEEKTSSPRFPSCSEKLKGGTP